MKNVLVILPYIPFPLDCGGNNAIYFMIDGLRSKANISLLFDVRSHGLGKGASASKMKNIEALKQRFPNVTFYLYEGQDEHTHQKEKGNTCARILRFLGLSLLRKQKRIEAKWNQQNANGDPVRAKSQLYNALPQYDPGFLEYVTKTARQGWDVIQVEMYEYLFLGYLLPKDTYKVFVHHELRYVRNQNELGLFKAASCQDRMTCQQAKDIEMAALKQYDEILTLTDHDKGILEEEIPQMRITTSPVGMDVNGDTCQAFQAGTDFVFVGSGNHFPNQDALTWLADSVLPLIRQQEQSVKIYVVGRWSQKQSDALAKANPEIEFVGFVPDLTAFLNGKISIVPLRIGSGMRIKILDSIKANSPFVSTSKGSEGLPFRHNQECLIADDANAFAQAMLSIKQDNELQQSLSTGARVMFNQYLSPEVLLEKRLRVYDHSETC